MSERTGEHAATIPACDALPRQHRRSRIAFQDPLLHQPVFETLASGIVERGVLCSEHKKRQSEKLIGLIELVRDAIDWLRCPCKAVS